MDYIEDLLRANPDQWSCYVHYIEAMFEITAKNAAVVDRAKTFLFTLMEQERLKSTNKLRGPYLAMLYFWQQLQQHQLDAATVFGTLNISFLVVYLTPSLIRYVFVGNFREFAQEYVEVMGDKPCAFQDLKPFVNSLPPDQVAEFLSCVSQSVGLNDGQSPTTVINVFIF